MRRFKVNVKVPIQVTWMPELVEDDSNFYMKLTPRVNTSGVAGAPRLTRITDGNTTRYMTLKHFNYNAMALEEAKKKAEKLAKEDPDMKKALVAGAKGKSVNIPTQPTSAQQSVLDRIASEVSEEDKALGGGIGREQEDKRLLATGFSEKEIEKFTKGKEE